MQRKKVLIIGGGGHGSLIASVVNDNLRHNPSYEYEIAGFLNDYEKEIGSYPVLGGTDKVEELLERGFYFAWGIHLIGRNFQTREVFERISVPRDRLVSIVHHSAFVCDDVVLEPGCLVMSGAYIAPRTRLGSGTMVKSNVCIGHDVECGQVCHFAMGCRVASFVRLGEACNVAIGSIVLEKRTLGDCSMVGAGSLVTKDIPKGELWLGSPAVRRGHIGYNGIEMIKSEK